MDAEVLMRSSISSAAPAITDDLGLAVVAEAPGEGVLGTRVPMRTEAEHL